MSASSQTRYAPLQRQGAVAEAMNTGKPTKDVAATWGVSVASLRSWLALERGDVLFRRVRKEVPTLPMRPCARRPDCKAMFRPDSKFQILCPLCRADDGRKCH
jgi:transposase-like protein